LGFTIKLAKLTDKSTGYSARRVTVAASYTKLIFSIFRKYLRL
jgi:hypothetical protein